MLFTCVSTYTLLWIYCEKPVNMQYSDIWQEGHLSYKKNVGREYKEGQLKFSVSVCECLRARPLK